MHGPQSVDVLTAVAPYVPTGALPLLPADARRHEPLAAFDGGPDGLDVVRRVVDDAARVLRPGGWLVVEVGGTQDDALEPELTARGFTAVTPGATPTATCGAWPRAGDADQRLRSVSTARPR